MNKRIAWNRVADLIASWASEGMKSKIWKAGQEHSLAWIAARLSDKPGLIVADEVGLGKTRVAATVATAVIATGGRVAVLIPPGLKSQWEGEFAKLHRAMAPWCAEVPIVESRFLRTYDDLFDVDQRDRVIWTHRPALTFISHQFGIPQHLTDTEQRRSRGERWLLPIKVRAQLLDDRRKVTGLGNIDLHTEHRQSEAALWLAERVGRQPKLAARIAGADVLKPSTGPTVFSWDDGAREIFHRLIGELIGPVDLIIVDEAHKNREGAQSEGPGDQSRLSACMNEILKPVAMRDVRRLALTATPLELDVEQWRDVFARVGMPKAQIEDVVGIATRYGDMLRDTAWFAGMDTTKLETVAEAFQAALTPWVTRRRWCDHETIQAYRQRVAPQASLSHPHRHWMEPVPWKMDHVDRSSVLAAEALAQVVKGGEDSAIVKTLGSRYAQGLTGMGETSPDQEAVPTILADAAAAQDLPRDARSQRFAFWSRMLANTADNELALSQKEEIRLQSHPRVRYAIEVVEKAAGVNDAHAAGQPAKVLVFGAYNAPLGALNRALNIRAFFRDFRKSEPTLMPTTLHLDDPDVRYWARCFDVDLDQLLVRDTIDELRSRYERRRSEQRRAYNDAVRHWVDARFSPSIASQIRKMEPLLVDWLNVHPETDNTPESISGALDRLFDNDPSDDAQDNMASHPSSLPDLDVIRNAIAEDLPGGQMQRSAFARFMYGETPHPTRRTLQYRFNQKEANPQILLAQASVASEGLNLHEACRKVVLFHLDWNPARIEQQIGRIDRQDSLWMKSFNEWASSDGDVPAPVIEIYTVALEGTYDEHRRGVVTARQQTLRSQIFGQIVPDDALDVLPQELLDRLAAIAPNFSPLVAR